MSAQLVPGCCAASIPRTKSRRYQWPYVLRARPPYRHRFCGVQDELDSSESSRPQRFTAEDAKNFKEKGNKFNRTTYLSTYDDTPPDKDKDPKGFQRFLENKYSGRWSGRAGTRPVETILGRNKPALIVDSGKADFGFCFSCGTKKLSNIDRFCYKCGAQLEALEPSRKDDRSGFADTAKSVGNDDPFGAPASPQKPDGGFGAFASAAPQQSDGGFGAFSSAPGGMVAAKSVENIAQTIEAQSVEDSNATLASMDFSLGLGGAAAWGGKTQPASAPAPAAAPPTTAAPAPGPPADDGFGDFAAVGSSATQAPPPPAEQTSGFGDFGAFNSGTSTAPAPTGDFGDFSGASAAPAPATSAPASATGGLGDLGGLTISTPAAPAASGAAGIDLAGLYASSTPVSAPTSAAPQQQFGMPPGQGGAMGGAFPMQGMGGGGMGMPGGMPMQPMGAAQMMGQQQPGAMPGGFGMGGGFPPQQGGFGGQPQPQQGGFGGQPQQGMWMQQGQPMPGNPGMQPMGGQSMGMPPMGGQMGMPPMGGQMGMQPMGGQMGMQMGGAQQGGFFGMPQQAMPGQPVASMDGAFQEQPAEDKADKSFAALDVFAGFK